MSTNSKVLRETLNTHHKCERKMSFGEACYWLSQYKELALRAIRYAEEADRQLVQLRSFADGVTLKYEELRELIDGGSEFMTHADAIAELKALLSSDAEIRGINALLQSTPQAPVSPADLSGLRRTPETGDVVMGYEYNETGRHPLYGRNETVTVSISNSQDSEAVKGARNG